MANFSQAYQRFLKDEGGYANHPSDRGGETYKGIARRYHPSWDGWVIIDRLKAAYPRDFQQIMRQHAGLDEAVQGFYHQHFWQRYKLAGLHDQALAEKVLSFVVNSERGGGLALQRAINALGGDVAIDGVIGHKTMAAANQLDPEVLSMALSVYMGMYYLG